MDLLYAEYLPNFSSKISMSEWMNRGNWDRDGVQVKLETWKRKSIFETLKWHPETGGKTS